MNDLVQSLMSDAVTHYGFLGALIGGLFGQSDAKKKDKAAAKAALVPQVTKNTNSQTQENTSTQTQTNTEKAGTSISLTALVAEAEKAGFNPLTALRAGLGGAFSSSWGSSSSVHKAHSVDKVTQKSESSTTGHNAMAAVPTAPSIGSVVMGAINGTIDKAVGLGAQNSAQNAFLQGVQSNPTPMSRSFYTPSTISAGPAVQMVSSPALARGAPIAPTMETPTVTNPYSKGNVDPTSRDTAAAEERYGDIVGSIFGAKKLIDDALYNVTGTTLDDRWAKTTDLWNAGTAALSSSVKAAQDALDRGATAHAQHSIPLHPHARLKAGGW